MGKPQIERWAFYCDSHGDLLHQPTATALYEFLDYFKPTVRIHGGDFMNLDSLRQGASDEDKHKGIKEDIEQGVEFVNKTKTNVLLHGNHDDRLREAISKGCGRLREYSTLFHNQVIDSIRKCQHVPYDARRGEYKYGNFKFVHGYSTGKNAGTLEVGAYKTNVIAGHRHQFNRITIPNCDRDVAITCGLMGDIDRMEYMRKKLGIMAWENGWLYGFKYPTGELQVFEARMIGGKWRLPTEVHSL